MQAFQKTPIDFYVDRGGSTELTGTVVYPSGKPAPGAVVHLLPAPGHLANHPPLSRQHAAKVTTTADESGTFHLQLPRTGVYVLHAHTKGYMTSHVYDRETADHTPWLIDHTIPASPIHMQLSPTEERHIRVLPGGEDTHKGLMLYHADAVPLLGNYAQRHVHAIIPKGTSAWITGRTFGHRHNLIFDKEKDKVSIYYRPLLLTGCITDDAGQPVDRLVVSLSYRDWSTHEIRTIHTITKADGCYRFTPQNVSKSRGFFLNLNIDDPRFEPEPRKLIAAYNQQAVRQDIVLTRRAGRTIQVMVTDTDGLPVPDPRVTPAAFSQDRDVMEIFVGPGTRTIRIEAEGFQPEIRPISPADSMLVAKLKPVDKSDHRFVINGQVRAGDRLLADVRMQGVGLEPVYSNEIGMFQVFAPSERIRLQFSKTGYEWRSAEVANGDVIAMSPISKLEFEVVDARTGRVLPEIQTNSLPFAEERRSRSYAIRLQDQSDSFLTNRAGTFSIDLPNSSIRGPYLYIRAEGYQSRLIPLQALSIQPIVVPMQPIHLAMQPVKGRVLDDRGLPLAGASVAVKEYDETNFPLPSSTGGGISIPQIRGTPIYFDWQFNPAQGKVIMGGSSDKPSIPIVTTDAEGYFVTPPIDRNHYKVIAIGKQDFPTLARVMPPNVTHRPEELHVNLPRSWTLEVNINRDKFPHAMHIHLDSSRIRPSHDSYYVFHDQRSLLISGPAFARDMSTVTWTGLTPGTNRIQLSFIDDDNDFRDTFVHFTVAAEAGSTVNYNFGDGTGLSLGGTARQQGKPLPHRYLGLARGKVIVETVKTDANGQFLFEDLPENYYKVVLLSNREANQYETVTIRKRRKGKGLWLENGQSRTDLELAFD